MQCCMISKYHLNNPLEWLQRIFLTEASLTFLSPITKSDGKRTHRISLPDNVIDLIGRLASMLVVPDRPFREGRVSLLILIKMECSVQERKR